MIGPDHRLLLPPADRITVCRDILRVLDSTRIEAAWRERLRAEYQAELERLEKVREETHCG